MHAFSNTNKGGSDIFVTKFNSSGSLMFSTYLGGSSTDVGLAIAVDNQSNCYVTGYTYSTNFFTRYAYNSSFSYGYDVFISKFDTNGSLIFSSYLGGNNYDQAYGIAVDSTGNSYITGNTLSHNFPTKNAFNSQFINDDAFLVKFFAFNPPAGEPTVTSTSGTTLLPPKSNSVPFLDFSILLMSFFSFYFTIILDRRYSRKKD